MAVEVADALHMSVRGRLGWNVAVEWRWCVCGRGGKVSIVASISTIVITVLEDRADAGQIAMLANVAVRDSVSKVGTVDRALETVLLLPVRMAVNTTSVNAAANGHHLCVG